jgi:hypothetical protein
LALVWAVFVKSPNARLVRTWDQSPQPFARPVVEAGGNTFETLQTVNAQVAVAVKEGCEAWKGDTCCTPLSSIHDTTAKREDSDCTDGCCAIATDNR